MQDINCMLTISCLYFFSRLKLLMKMIFHIQKDKFKVFCLRDHSFSTYAKFSEKHSRNLPPDKLFYECVRNISFSENFAHVPNELSLMININEFEVSKGQRNIYEVLVFCLLHRWIINLVQLKKK